MATTAYTTDADILKIRDRVSDFIEGLDTSVFHLRAAELVNRDITKRWYMQECRKHGINWLEVEFEQQYLHTPSAEAMANLVAYRVLELIYEYSAQDTLPEHDVFSAQARKMHIEYEKEFRALFSYIVSYDWSKDGTIDVSETSRRRRVIRLVRG